MSVMEINTSFYACQLTFFFWLYRYINIQWGPWNTFFTALESDSLQNGRKSQKSLCEGLFQSIAGLLLIVDISYFMGTKTCFYAHRFLFFFWFFLYIKISNGAHGIRSMQHQDCSIVGKSMTIPTPRRIETLSVAIEMLALLPHMWGPMRLRSNKKASRTLTTTH